MELDLDLEQKDCVVHELGTPKIQSPLELSKVVGDGVTDYVPNDERVLFQVSYNKLKDCFKDGKDPLSFEKAGPREMIYFEPAHCKVGIVTCGGLCPGINDVIRGLVMKLYYGYGVKTIYGFKYGYMGLIREHGLQPIVIDPEMVSDIHEVGGTILGSSRGPQDVSRMVDRLMDFGLNILFCIGGDGTLNGAQEIYEEVTKRGLNLSIIGIPKTIDNDLEKTDYTFGFQTAVQVACDALDRLQTTGRSHDRVMILEVMGRNAGWIALEAGIAGGAHIILIPEIEYDIENVIRKIMLRKKGGSPFSIIMIAEGAREKGGTTVKAEDAQGRLQGVEKLGGVGFHLAKQIENRIDLEVRTTVLGHIQRGGSPNSFDRVLGTRLGSFAVDAAAQGRFGTMVALKTPDMVLVDLKDLAGKVRTVSLDSQLIRCAESIGINMGREAM